MAVSLVSTGVQFPDSTIQTTAASASSVVLIQAISVSGSPTEINFTTGFSSTTYGSYQVVVGGLQQNGSSKDLRLQLGFGGGSPALMSYTGTASLNTGGNAWDLSVTNSSNISFFISSGYYTSGTVYIQNPNDSYITGWNSQFSTGAVNDRTRLAFAGNCGYNTNGTLSYIRLTTGSSSFTQGQVYLYGIKKS